jgi:hypothetical protein
MLIAFLPSSTSYKISLDAFVKSAKMPDINESFTIQELEGRIWEHWDGELYQHGDIVFDNQPFHSISFETTNDNTLMFCTYRYRRPCAPGEQGHLLDNDDEDAPPRYADYISTIKDHMIRTPEGRDFNNISMAELLHFLGINLANYSVADWDYFGSPHVELDYQEYINTPIAQIGHCSFASLTWNAPQDEEIHIATDVEDELLLGL